MVGVTSGRIKERTAYTSSCPAYEIAIHPHVEDVNRVGRCKRDVITSRVKAERRPSDFDADHFHGNLTQNRAVAR